MSNYVIPAGEGSAEYEIKRSRFITTVRHIKSNDEMKAFLKEMREKHPKSRHNCWALISSSPTDSNGYGFSDDGEPNGTAGKPMFTVLQHSGVGQIGMIVTRYFGGIKLGTGGLVKAYTEAAKIGLENTPLVPYSKAIAVRVNAVYSQEPHIRYILDKYNITANFEYASDVTVTFEVKESELELVTTELKRELGNNLSLSW